VISPNTPPPSLYFRLASPAFHAAMDMDPCHILEVELLSGPEDKLEPVDSFLLSEEEMLALTDAAVAQILARAASAISPCGVKRLSYRDDEDDWCTLNKSTLFDAVAFAAPAANGLRKLQVRIVTDAAVPQSASLSAETPAEAEQQQAPQAMTATPGGDSSQPDVDMKKDKEGILTLEELTGSLDHLCDGINKMLKPEDGTDASGSTAVDLTVDATGSIASASGGSSSSNKAAAPGDLHMLAIEQLNRLAADLDLRRLVPKLAIAGLRIVEEVQAPALFPLLDVLCALRDGDLKAEMVPELLHVFAEAVDRVPTEEKMRLFVRVKEEAERAVQELREEQAKEESKEMEVHPNVICDGCNARPIIGNRYKSLEQDDFDLCKACYDREARDPSCWVRVKSGITGRVVASFYGASSQEPMHHGVECDGCGMHPIVGKRFKCLDLNDYDLCQSCKARSDEQPETANRRFKEVPAKTCAVTCAAMQAFEAVEATVSSQEPEEEEALPAEQGPSTKRRRSEVETEDEDEEAASMEGIEEAEALLAGLPAAALRACLASLLRHPGRRVRQAAFQAALEAASSAAPLAEEAPKEEEMKIDSEPEPAEEQGSEKAATEDEWDLMAEAGDKDKADEGTEPQEEEKKDKKRSLSATVMGSSPLVLGVEAEEVFDARGDATEEFGQLVAQCGAQQAFRIGRVEVPAGKDATTVPACAKIVVVNDGEEPWPETAVVALAAGESMGFPHMPLGSVKPGEAAEIVMDLMIPAMEAAGTGRSAWALVDAGSGASLGPLLFFEIVWVGQQ